MKTFLLIALILLAVNVYADDQDPLKAVDDNPNNEDKDPIAAKSEDDGTGTQFSEAETENDKDVLDEALNEDMGTTDTITKEGISIGLTPGKDIIIRLGGSKGGGGYGSGVTYTRWGKRSCPSKATRVYEGYAAGGWYSQKGNGANYLCMPRDAQYLSRTSVAWPSYLYGAEYETANRIFSGTTQDYNVPCTVCHVPRSSKITVPGKYTCPQSWKREYYGYLMTSHYGHNQQVLYECVDVYPDRISGSRRNLNGALFYFVQVVCGRGLPCGPYIANKAVTCAVCTK